MELITLIFSIILLSVTLSIDALAAGISYGLSGTRIPLISKIIICAFSLIYATAALLLGKALANLLPLFAGKIIGAAVLAGLGVFMIIKSRKKPRNAQTEIADNSGPQTICKIILKSLGITIEILKNNPSAGDIDRSGTIDKKESLLLGFALSVDSLGVVIGGSLSGLSSWYIPPAVALCQLFFLSSGLFTGSLLCKKRRAVSGKYDAVTQLLPGVLLIVFSIIRLF